MSYSPQDEFDEWFLDTHNDEDVDEVESDCYEDVDEY